MRAFSESVHTYLVQDDLLHLSRCTPIVEMMMISRAFVHAFVVRLAVILIGTFE